MKNFHLNLIVLITIMILSVNAAYAQVYNLGETYNNYAWFKLGTLTLPQQGYDAEIKIVSGNGYNALQNQQGECIVHFRTSNSASQNGGFYGSGSFYNTGRSKIVSNMRVVQIAFNTWDFYGLLPAYTGSGSILSVLSFQGSWSPTLALSSPPDNSIFINLTEEFLVQSDAYFNANVGIGTVTPREKLSVNGKIRAQEVKVETQNWPDYVFKKDYLLTSLPDLEKYIAANNHLPEIPAAAEVEKEGIALGAMNKMLLKKIEELTLLLIEQNKRIEKLESVNSTK